MAGAPIRKLCNSCCVIVHLTQNTFLNEKTIQFSKKEERKKLRAREGERERKNVEMTQKVLSGLQA